MVKEQFYFKDLDVWQKSVDFARNVIQEVENNSSGRKHFRLLEQIDASATSVPMNIAEGKGRYSKKEFVHFLYIARGSLYETITLLTIFQKMNWIQKQTTDELEKQGLEITKMINGLIKSIRN